MLRNFLYPIINFTLYNSYFPINLSIGFYFINKNVNNIEIYSFSLSISFYSVIMNTVLSNISDSIGIFGSKYISTNNSKRINALIYQTILLCFICILFFLPFFICSYYFFEILNIKKSAAIDSSSFMKHLIPSLILYLINYILQSLILLFKLYKSITILNISFIILLYYFCKVYEDYTDTELSNNIFANIKIIHELFYFIFNIGILYFNDKEILRVPSFSAILYKFKYFIKFNFEIYIGQFFYCVSYIILIIYLKSKNNGIELEIYSILLNYGGIIKGILYAIGMNFRNELSAYICLDKTVTETKYFIKKYIIYGLVLSFFIIITQILLVKYIILYYSKNNDIVLFDELKINIYIFSIDIIIRLLKFHFCFILKIIGKLKLFGYIFILSFLDNLIIGKFIQIYWNTALSYNIFTIIEMLFILLIITYNLRRFNWDLILINENKFLKKDQ